MRLYVALGLALASAVAVSQDDPFLKGADLQAAIAKDCSDGCITFNRQEAQEFQDQLELLIAQKQKEAFQAGVNYQRQACASLI